MFGALKNFMEWVASGADRELQRIRESRKYTSYWLGVMINYGFHIYLLFYVPDFEAMVAIVVDAVENHAIFYGIYAGANAIQKSGAASKYINASTGKTTNNEDESDPEDMPF